MPFLTQFSLTFVNGRDAVSNKIPVGWKYEKTGELVRIPSGFESDGASIPSFLWPKVKIPFTNIYLGLGHPFDSEHRREAHLHDYLCRCGPDIGIKRSKADRMFLAALLESDRKPRWKCYEFYAGVRIGAVLGIGVPE